MHTQVPDKETSIENIKKRKLSSSFNRDTVNDFVKLPETSPLSSSSLEATDLKSPVLKNEDDERCKYIRNTIADALIIRYI